MDFRRTAERLLKAFEMEGVRYGLIGGFALGLWGVHRSTVDIDFLVHRDDLPKVDRIMRALGYESRFRSENVSQFTSPLAAFGEVDFLHAFREAAVGMLERAEEREVFSGALTLRVVRPEDLIGLKVQAMTNDERRQAGDLADIEALLDLHGKTVDWERIEGYFALFDGEDLFAALKEKYHG
jgi:hypothetical protein